MAKFITNIQLQGADKNEYDFLYKALEKAPSKNKNHQAGRNIYIAGKDAFSLEENVTLQDINDAVFRASSKTGRRYSFFVVRHKRIV